MARTRRREQHELAVMIGWEITLPDGETIRSEPTEIRATLLSYDPARDDASGRTSGLGVGGRSQPPPGPVPERDQAPDTRRYTRG